MAVAGCSGVFHPIRGLEEVSTRDNPIWDIVESTFETPFRHKEELSSHAVRLLEASEREGAPAKTRQVAKRLGLYCMRLSEEAPIERPLYFDSLFHRFIREMHSDTPPKMSLGKVLASGGYGVVSSTRYGSMKGLVEKKPLREGGDSLKREAINHHLIDPTKGSVIQGGIYFPFFVDRAIPERLIYEAAKGDCLGALRAEGFTAEAIRTRFFRHAQTLSALHAQGLVHLDYKLKNGLELEDGKIVLADFSSLRCVKGTPGEYSAEYVSPELALGEAVTPSMDVFSFGMVLYHALSDSAVFSGENPFSLAVQVCAASQETLSEKVVKLDGNETVLERDPDGLGRHLIAALLRKDPGERPSMEQICSHPYLCSGRKGSLAEWERMTSRSPDGSSTTLSAGSASESPLEDIETLLFS